VWNQQRYLLDLKGISDDPIDKFDDDLLTFLTTCLQSGEQIILGIDANTDNRTGNFQQRLQACGMTNLFLFKFGHDIPPTYSRGSTPIDCFYVSLSLLQASAGFLPIFCDHRVLWMDIPLEVVFGRSLPSTKPVQPNRLVLHDPRIVNKYVESLQNYLENVNFLESIRKLQKKMHTDFSEHDILVYNQLDKIRTTGILLADKKCRKLKMGAVPFSPRLVVVWNEIKAWKLVRRKLKGGKVNARFLQRVTKKALLADTDLLSLQEVEQKLSAAFFKYKTVKKEAMGYRNTWLEEVAAARANEGRLSVAQEIRNLQTREKQRREARQIKQAMASRVRQGLSSVEIQSNEGTWVELTDQSDIEEALLRELELRFNQASSTPFCGSPLLENIGRMGELPAAKSILGGQYNPSGQLDEWSRALIPFLRQTIPTCKPNTISISEHIAGWKRVKERTAAGPSGITIPHFKAHGSSLFLSEIDTIMANLPYTFGFSPERWQKGLDVMIPKKPGIRHINTLRAILLFEADFNQNNKRLGREMIFRAEKFGAVAREQFGSRKHMSAIDQSLNKALTFDIWRQLRQSGALCSNDAKSCYDRIVHNCASICMQRVGTPIQPIISMFSTIQQLKHHTKTVFGESSKGYRPMGHIPIQGVGQGNGAGPQIWALVSTPILNMLRTNGLGAHFRSAITHQEILLAGYAFVDDTDLVSSSPDGTAISTVKKLQESVTAWEGGLRTTGGAIVPEKTHWYLIEFAWQDGIPTYKPVSEAGGRLQVRDHNGILQELRQLEPWEAERTLGIRLAPDGNMLAQFNHMAQVATEWAGRLQAGCLPRHLTWLAWKTTIQKTLEYPLAVTTLSRAQCSKLTSIVARYALPRCGVVSSFPRAIMHAPLQFGGLQIPDLYIEQGIAHISKLVRYSQTSRHSTGILLRHSCEAFKLEGGCSGPIFSLPGVLEAVMTPSWVTHTWRFLREFGIEVIDDIPDFKPRRLNDQLLVPLFIKLGYAGRSLLLLNQCRLFLRVTWLSDLVTADGSQFEATAFSPDFCKCYEDGYQYPRQGNPSREAWRLWEQALQRMCNKQRALTQELGSWVSRESIVWWYDAPTQRLYKSTSGFQEFIRARPTKTRSSLCKFRLLGQCESIPATATPASVTVTQSEVRLTGIGQYTMFSTAIPNNMDWILEHIHFPGNLATSFRRQNNQALAISDGSFKSKHGTAAWIIFVSPECQLVGKTITPGDPADQCAFRSELAGLYGIACTLFHLEHGLGITGEITIGCDGISALRQVAKNEDFIDPNLPHYDLILATRVVLSRTSWKSNWFHVKGHQDDSKPVEELDLPSQLNIRMDAMAKQHWKETVGVCIDPDLAGEPWTVRLAGRKVTSRLREQVRLSCLQGSALGYWQNKSRFRTASTANIDWEVFGAALKACPPGMQRWVSKTVTGFCATGVNMKRRKERDSDECPRCHDTEEVEHIWTCKEHSATDLWNRSVAKLQEWLNANQISPEVSRQICVGLQEWRTGQPSTWTSEVPWVKGVLEQQKTLGWRNFFEGFLAREWRAALDAFLLRIGSPKSSKRWLSQLVRKQWLIAWDLWEHRNGFLHEKEDNLASREVNSKILEEFQIGCRDLDKQSRALFAKGSAEIIAKPLEIRQQWVRRVQAARARVQEEDKRAGYQLERKLMARWVQQSSQT
jgi:hypothetical protein